MSNNKANGSSNREPSSRPSPPPPLAPLQYLQNQRRGSITDPSLHAAPNMKLNTSYRPPGEQPSSASSGASSVLHDARPVSPYVFGDATPHGGNEMQIRNLLRSSPDAQGGKGKEMEVDAGFDYNMRRHSIAVQGVKRKMGEEVLAGPGVPREQGPAAKRRGSAIDTARIAELSLHDRRNSWLGDRRDSTSPSAFAGPSAFASFTWPTPPTDMQDTQQKDSDQSSSKQKDSPYSRSPELRVSHKLAERKRRKEMKDLFDELRDQLPADRGMKASKWEILTKAIEFVINLKQSHQEMAREVDMLRHELDAARQGLPFPPPYGQSPIPGQFPGPMPHHHQPAIPPPPPMPHSRPPSAENPAAPPAALDSRMEPPAS
ncbi:hypothetical protein H0H92_000859 [Tricholoma furcatifolium]|nr:hypothetical protein H0H92_000859 [Tricholoma furcatifolium]